jgi:hypothetical protein
VAGDAVNITTRRQERVPDVAALWSFQRGDPERSKAGGQLTPALLFAVFHVNMDSVGRRSVAQLDHEPDSGVQPVAEATTHVRLKKSTLARLRRVSTALIDSIEKGLRDDLGVNQEAINPRGTGLSMDAVICLLLDEREKHLQRAAESRARARARRQQDVQD